MTEWVHIDDLRAEREAADRREIETLLTTMRRKYQGREDGDSLDIMRLLDLCEGALWAVDQATR